MIDAETLSYFHEVIYEKLRHVNYEYWRAGTARHANSRVSWKAGKLGG